MSISISWMDSLYLLKEPQEARWTLLFARADLYSEVSCDSVFVCSSVFNLPSPRHGETP